MLVEDLVDRPARGDPNHYRSGWLPSNDPERPHHLVVALQTEDGTRHAAAICTDMARSFPGLRAFVMCGIAGGIPAPDEPQRHVRLGDIVVATEGIVDYDHVRTVDGVDRLRRPVEGLSTDLLRADHELEMKQLSGAEPWRIPLSEALERAEGFRRPPGHRNGWPRVHRGAVGSADRLLRDPARRDMLATQHRIRAVEMEGSGIAVGSGVHERHWFMVRGIADHCDDRKSDEWHRYAALAAAAYVRALLAECQPLGQGTLASREPVHGLQAIVDALLSVRPMRDDYQRRAILAELPAHIRAVVPDSVTGRLHVVALVRTCEEFPDGEDSLVDALRLTIGSSSAEFQRVEAIIRSNWSGR